MEKIKPVKIKKEMKVSELVEGMKEAGFGARKIGRASEIMKKMFFDEECRVFLGVRSNGSCRNERNYYRYYQSRENQCSCNYRSKSNP